VISLFAAVGYGASQLQPSKSFLESVLERPTFSHLLAFLIGFGAYHFLISVPLEKERRRFVRIAQDVWEDAARGEDSGQRRRPMRPERPEQEENE
jgi:hypothetical protein